MKDFVLKADREFLRKRTGSLNQVAGLVRYEFCDGKAKGVEAVDFKTGSGFRFTVLPGRGMDIAWAEYKGVPLSYMSKTGIVSPAYYEHDGMNWLRSFFAGMMTTCGLSNVGWPCEEADPAVGAVQHGLHGRISNTGAENVCTNEEWTDSGYEMSVSGKMRESMLHCENLTLKRTVKTGLGRNCLTICDVVENEGFTERPLMLLYHINAGYPVLDEGSRFVGHSYSITPSDRDSEKNLGSYGRYHGPVAGSPQDVYFHDLRTDGEGTACAGIINDALEMGVYVKFNKRQLNKFTQWKCLSEAEYVTGLEPGNCYPIGRTGQRERGDLQSIKPGEKREFRLEIGVLKDRSEIREFEEKAACGSDDNETVHSS